MDKNLHSGLGKLGGVGLLGAAALMGSTMLTAPAAAQSMEELKAQIDKLQGQVEELERRQAAPVQAVTGGDKPRTFKLPGSDTSMQVGGYVKGDFIYDVKSKNDGSFNVASIATKGTVGDEREGHVNFHAQQSRMWVKTWTPSDLGEVRTHLEFDFEGGNGNEIISNSRHPRLRHAYGTLGGFLAGQTWTNFMSLHSYPDTVDFFGPTGMPFLRQVQLRYTFTPSPGLAVSVSVENPETTLVDEGSSPATTQAESLGSTIAIDQVPDFTAAVKYSGGPITVKGAAVARWLTVDNGAGIDDEAFAWGLHGSLSANVFGRDMIQANIQGGDGIGRYILMTNVFNTLETGGDIETVFMWAFSLGYLHRWNDFLQSQIAWGHGEADDGDLATGSQSERQDSVHLNLQWRPTPRTIIGIEGIYGRKTVNSNPGADNTNDQIRLQLGARFSF